MSESSWRKRNDPSYGRTVEPPIVSQTKSPTDIATERGLVICNPMEIEGNCVKGKSSDLNPDELRFSLLYWDKLAWPKSRGIDFGENHDALFLRQSGILSRPVPKRDTFSALGDILLHGQFSILKELDMIQPGQWAMAQGENSLSLHPDFKESTKSGDWVVELHRAIPIPAGDVPLQEILEFKYRRRDELLLLRSHFEALASEISVSSDPEITLRDKIAEVDSACANLLEVGREWRWPIKLGSWNASITVEPVKMASYAAGFATAADRVYSVGMPACMAIAAATALASTLSLKPSSFEFQGIKRPRNPYRYAYSIDAELR